ncbi:hypothetical protein TCAL_04973 [Tigriopus californicus]|uniref:BHLH domain-containing protein n=1 Tax=Tigriopus californicus TaxID=6832 RepID=A0A553PDB1_TIGCA|nr:hypothetical protein TCAL_04973 [Tigriopus californicus]|eukprot:TCALIF_04973-PA protein Name:"Protein of unknown function" AED:0.01 eAED:0.01 QI:306/1/0.66/1/0/0/3/0/91
MDTCTEATKRVPGQISSDCSGENDVETYNSKQFQVELLKLHAILPTNCHISLKRIQEGLLSEDSVLLVQTAILRSAAQYILALQDQLKDEE